MLSVNEIHKEREREDRKKYTSSDTRANEQTVKKKITTR